MTASLDEGIAALRQPRGWVPRLYADVHRLRALDYKAIYDLRTSLADVLRYYWDDVCAAAERDAAS
jgi:hypothetical protein